MHESRPMLGGVTHAPSFTIARTAGALLDLDMFAADGCSSMDVAQWHGKSSAMLVQIIVGRLFWLDPLFISAHTKGSIHPSH